MTEHQEEIMKEENIKIKPIKVNRFFTKENIHPFDEIKWIVSKVQIKNLENKIVFDHDVEHPDFWDNMAIRICAEKYFKTENLENHPLGGERSVKDVIHRVAYAISERGSARGYFDEENKNILYNELCYIIVHQIAAFNSPVFFNLGLSDVYNFKGNSKAERYGIKDIEGETYKQEFEYENGQTSACKSGDTLVITNFGPRYIEDVVEMINNNIDINVLGSQGFTKVLAGKYNGIKPTYKITFYDGNQLRITDDDQMFIYKNYRKKGWSHLHELMDNKKENIFDSRMFSAKSKIINSYEDKEIDCLDISKAAICGWIQTDGYFNRPFKSSSSILDLLVINEEKEEIFSHLKKIYPDKHIKIRDRNISNKEIQLQSMRIYGNFLDEIWKKIYNLNKLECGVPEKIKIYGSKKEVIAYLRSAFQADGCIICHDNNCLISFGGVNKQLSLDIFYMIRNLGIFARYKEIHDKRKNRRNGHMIYINNYSEIVKFYNIIGFIGKTKQEKLKKYIESHSGKTKHIDGWLSAIKKIEFYEEEKVYDIETESHDFYANGILVHNCFITKLTDELKNGRDGIYDWIENEMTIFANGSGSGTNVSALRGEGESITGGGISSGLISFLKIADTSAGSIKSGGKTRRSSKMLILDDTHPDLIDFIEWKTKEEKKARSLILMGYTQDWNDDESVYKIIQAQNANNSIRVSNEFMNAVKNNDDWELKFITNNKTKCKLKARDIFNKIVDCTWECGDPGLFYKSTVDNWNPVKNSGEIKSTNPCVVGETLVATADGRNYVPIKQLVDEGKDVPVYSYNLDKKIIEIKMARNPRKTGINKKILKIILDDNSYIRTTENHKFMLKNGEYIEAKDLKKNDSLMPFNKFELKRSKEKKCTYWYISQNNLQQPIRAEHNLIMEFKLNHNIEEEFCVHHKDYNGLNNNIDNLLYLNIKEHNKLHLLDKNKNPMQDLWWNKISKERKNEYRQKLSKAISGEKNGRYINITNEEIFNHACALALNLNRSFTSKEWIQYCKKNNIPNSNFRKKVIGNYSQLSKNVSELYNLKRLSKKTKLNKICKNCNTKFEVYLSSKKKKCCCKECSIELQKNTTNKQNKERQLIIKENQMKIFNDLKYKFGRTPYKKEWIKECKNNNISSEISRKSSPFSSYEELKNNSLIYNHRIKEIIEDGYEDVYNITVDDNHNLAYITNTNIKTKDGKQKLSGIITKNCAEFVFLENSACNLASVNLIRFLNDDNTWNIDMYQHVIETLILSMEIIVSIGSYPTEDIAKNSRDFRPLGLGYCNMGGLIMALGFPYDSDNARIIISCVTSLLTAFAYRMSSKISSHIGPFKEYLKNKNCFLDVIQKHMNINSEIKTRIKFTKQIHSKAVEVWNETFNIGKKHGFRNAQVTVLAPTGTIGFLMGTTNGGIEPAISLTMTKSMSDGTSITLITNEVKRALNNLGYNDKQIEQIMEHIKNHDSLENCGLIPAHQLSIFDTAIGARTINPMAHIMAVASAQPFLSGGISKTVNMPYNSTKEEIAECYIKAWELGCKAISIYRDSSKWSQPLNPKFQNSKQDRMLAEINIIKNRIEKQIKNNKIKEDYVQKFVKALMRRRKAPDRSVSERLNFTIGNENIKYHVVRYPDNGIAELFIELGKQGTTVTGLVDTIGRILSIAIQYGVPIEALCDTMRDQKYEPAGWMGENPLKIGKGHSIADLTAKVMEKLQNEYLGIKEQDHMDFDFAEEAKKAENLDIFDERQAALAGYAGIRCENCGSWKTKGTIKCGVCLECGSSYGTCA